jgi:hypothetical protein
MYINKSNAGWDNIQGPGFPVQSGDIGKVLSHYVNRNMPGVTPISPDREQ